MFKGLKFIKELECGSLHATFVSPISGEWEYVFKTDQLSKEEFEDYYNGAMIQNAMPRLTPKERDYFLNGYNSEESDRIDQAAKEAESDYPDW